jgi:long-chain acyl-CoA synthetase
MKLEQLLETNVKLFGEYPMLYFQEKQFTNIETKRISDRFAKGLRKLGIAEGDKVMVILPNCPEVIFSYQAINRAGAIIVPVMFTLHPKEIHYIVANSGVKAIITSSFVLEKVRTAVRDLDSQPAIIAVDVASENSVLNFYDVLVDETDSRELVIATAEDDTAVILYTSGTTGSPKGVLLTHKNLYTNAENSAKHNETERGTTLGVLPLAHVYGLTVSNITMLLGGSIVIFPSFNLDEVFAAIERHQVKSFSAVPAMIHAMLSYPYGDKYDTSSLESVSSGSAPLPVALINAFKSKFNADIYEGYGLSEAAPIVTAHRKGIQIKPGSVGIPIPGVEIKIVDDGGKELPVGEVGELIVRGDNVTQGYFNNPDETDKILKNHWLHTGDIARLDEDGYLYIVDRKKDLIIRGGFNLYPRDVEEILNRHEAVSEASVIGIPDERMGEEMVACIVKKAGSEASAEELIRYCHEHLAKNKTPRQILFMEALPRNGVGKILKTHLRQTVADIISSSKQK